MKTFFKIFLIAIISFVILVLAVFAYVIIKNPFGLGGVIETSILKQDVTENLEKYKDYDHPLLTEEQEEAVIKAGLDIEQIPTEITPKQVQCGVDKLGQDRINEIITDSEPTPLEVVKILPCINTK